MKISVKVPALRGEKSESVMAAWLKEPGEPVKVGDALYELETDKVVNQIEATVEGVLSEVLVEEGDQVSTGQEIATISQE